ncbi:polysaccharide biosynthesis protein (plasmid) [Dinoroseobacter shibae]|uniref:polysaccharide biosynthesis protein n=1 Tax=Dinoroseobacter shibae TaxID=215813 RepID=UPI0002DA5CC8|nr:nucleoside-diphosphate sugar epimerase/dehydratase [Dinoroseobacter shibae]URF48926.1 polysaccharide biosynthesis protein [Dinoroseobacter shibae]URF53238.1 polysaccharide biosynthesis protein [Dinoroseobacter shibae]
MLNFVKSLTLGQKAITLLVVDLVLIPLALIVTFALQPIPVSPGETIALILPILPYLLAASALVAFWLGIPYIRLNAYEARAVGKTAQYAAANGLIALVLSKIAGLGLTTGLYVIFAGCFFLFSAASRVVMLQILTAIYRRDEGHTRVMIYGAGTTGTQLVSALNAHKTIYPVAFVDDNAALHGLTVAGLPVHSPVRIRELVRDKQIDRVLLAVPSLSQPKQAQLARRLQKLGLEVQALPSFSQLIGEEELVDKLKPVESHTFLGRQQVCTELERGCESYADRVVLISGAGGSIGSELCRQVLACRPAKLVLYELNELALYNVDMELRSLAEVTGTELVPVLGSVTDPRQVRGVLAEHKVQVVLHAAAYKHVPLVEANPLAGLANNVFGTQTLAREAAEYGIERFILISSDKAVRPTNVMGASKRLAELVIQDLETRYTGTVFTMVRFGNVLGSSGSVVPLFQEQIRRGGPVTVTDPKVTRYFMTVQEAVRLVLTAGSMARGGEVFVLDMGAPVPIVQLARQVIESAGYTVRDDATPDGDIEIVFTGLRPGEKMFEELTITDDHIGTRHPKLFCAREQSLSEIEIAGILRSLRQAVASGDPDAGRAVITRWVEGYVPGVKSVPL